MEYRIDAWIREANEYARADQPFSSAFVWQKVVQYSPEPLYQFYLCQQLRHCGDYETAMNILDNILFDGIPKGLQRYIKELYGLIHLELGHYSKAIDCFSFSIENGSKETTPYILLASCYREQNQLNLSQQILEQALEQKGDLDEAHYNLSTIHARKGNIRKAIYHIKECLKIDSEYPNANEFLRDFENLQYCLK